MLTFEPIALKHRPLFLSSMAYFGERTTEGSFAALYIWSPKYKLSLCRDGGMLYLRSEFGKTPVYLLPRGPGDLAASLLTLERVSEREGCPFVLRGLTDAMKDRVEASLPGRYVFKPHPEVADYLYAAEDLRELSGKKYHAKRNFINRFENDYAGRWSYEEIDDGNLDDVWEFQASWCRKNHCSDNVSLQEEAAAIKLLLENREALGAYGGLLRVDGRVCAFTLGSPIGADTIDIHVEKADYDVAGAYPMINRAFLRHQGAWASFVNREEDMGLEGLRKAKQSYHPVALLEKYTATPL